MKRSAEFVALTGERYGFLNRPQPGLLDRADHFATPRPCRFEASHSTVSARNDGGTDRCDFGSFQKGNVDTRFATTEGLEVTVCSAATVLSHSVGMLSWPICESRSNASNASMNGPDSPNPLTLMTPPRRASAMRSDRSRSILPRATICVDTLTRNN